MAEVAGLVLGGIPLVISAVELIAEPLESYKDYHMNVLIFHSCLKIQKQKLEVTLSNIGLDRPTKDELRECINTKFPTIADEILYIYECIEKEMVKLMRKLGIDPHTKIGSILRASPADPKRIWNAISSRRRKATIRLLKELNEQLCDCLQMETSEMKAEDDDVVVLSLIKRFNIKHCDALRLCLASLHRALASGLVCACEVPHHAALDLDWHLDRSAMSPDLTIAFSYQDLRNTSAPCWRKLLATPSVTRPENTAQPSMAAQSMPSARASSVAPPTTPPRTPSPLRFWPSFWPSRAKVGQRGSSKQLSLLVPQPAVDDPAALVNLCEVLSSDITSEHVLQDDDEDHGRDFSLQLQQHKNVGEGRGEARITHLVPLTKALDPPQSHQRLSLKARCGLAACAALSVLHLSGGPWLSKDWDGSCVGIFFEKVENNAERLADRPWFLYNSLPLPWTCLDDDGDNHEADDAADDDQVTNLVCQDDHEKLLVPNITVFALGILLVELCVGKSFAPGTPVTATTIKARYEFAMSNLDKVYELAGDSYGDAAKKCIRFSFPGRDSHNIFEMEQFRTMFYRQVVAPIQAAYSKFPN
ncbi:hypothetical protein Sste5346_005061 [Sporothrix stenoceras]|uniref:DUF7580 domain-containing protein n=1 Tax=Sporothrix stenoceras TaxID=5173 RepID=A0ABR3Z5R3_9PEZI